MEDDGYATILTWLSRPGSLNSPFLAGRDLAGQALLTRGGRRGGTLGPGLLFRGDIRPRLLEHYNQLR